MKLFKTGFTLVELLVVILIVTILSVTSVLTTQYLKSRSRDAVRVRDIVSMQAALELYHRDNGYYPVLIRMGDPLLSPDGQKTYMAQLPHNPLPWNEQKCPNNDYIYSYYGPYSYMISFCLANKAQDLPAGKINATNKGFAVAPLIYSWQNLGDNQLFRNYENIKEVSMDVDSGNTPYVAIVDNDNNLKVFGFINNAWQSMGNAFTPPVADISLKVDNNGIIYVAFTEINNGNKGTVRRYRNNTWSTMGTFVQGSGTVRQSHLVIAPDNTPYIAYANGAASNKITVRKTDSRGDWVMVGPVISSGSLKEGALAISSNNVPYVAYRQNPSSGTLFVKYYNSATDQWNDVNATPPAGPSYELSLAFKRNNTPVLAFKNDDDGSTSYVKAYTNSAWTSVNSPVSLGEAKFNSLAVGSDDTLFLAYADSDNDNKLAVKKNSGSGWSVINSQFLTSSKVEYVNLDLTSSDLPIVAFIDHSQHDTLNVLQLNAR